MPLIIDCYNLLHATKPAGLAGLDESGLCRLLGSSVWREKRIVVVCDGTADPLGLNESTEPDVELVYAGRGQTADDLIINMIARDSAPKRLTVVSSDRQIRKAARLRRAKSVTSEQFLRELPKSIRSQSSRQDKTQDKPLSEHQVQQWLKAFGMDE